MDEKPWMAKPKEHEWKLLAKANGVPLVLLIEGGGRKNHRPRWKVIS